MNAGAVALGIDIGTSGCRLIAVDPDGRICGKTHRQWSLPTRANNASTQDPILWQEAVIDALAELRQSCSLNSLQRLSIDGTSGTVLATDSSGNPLGPALMYNDTQAIDQAREIEAIQPSAQQPLISLGAGSGLARLLWLSDQSGSSPGTLYFHQADWIAFQFTQTAGWTDEHNALKSGYNPLTESWPNWIQTLCEDRIPLPTVYHSGTAVQNINTNVAKTLGLPDTVEIISGTTDSTAAILATGASQTGDAITSLGSTLVTKVLANNPVFDPQRGIYSHRLNNHWIVGGASNSGAATLLQYFSLDEIKDLSTRINSDTPMNLDFYPLPATGERFPTYDPNKQNRTEPKPDNPAEFLQALFEGIANIETQAYQLLAKETRTPIKRLFSQGGGASNATWTQIRTQHHQLLTADPTHSEAAYGTALLALHATT